jgi:hypothetical protein
MPRWAARVDANQHAIVKAARWRGATVHLLHREGRGCPDLLVGFRGRNLLWEVKTEAGTMTDSEAAWHETWRGSVDIVWTVEQALDILDKIARE